MNKEEKKTEQKTGSIAARARATDTICHKMDYNSYCVAIVNSLLKKRKIDKIRKK
jgi:hypothetical protein